MKKITNSSFRKKSKTVLRKALTVAGCAVTLFVAALLVTVAVQMFSGKVPTVFGHRFYYILTDSMSPEILPGDVILSKVLNEEGKKNLKIGDTVTYIAKTGALTGQPITHRIVRGWEVDKDTGQRTLLTRGVKEGATVDAPITAEDLQAVMVRKSPAMGWLYSLVRSSTGYVLLVVIPVALVVAGLILKLIADVKAKQRADEREKQRLRVEQIKADAVKSYLEAQQPPREEEIIPQKEDFTENR